MSALIPNRGTCFQGKGAKETLRTENPSSVLRSFFATLSFLGTPELPKQTAGQTSQALSRIHATASDTFSRHRRRFSSSLSRSVPTCLTLGRSIPFWGWSLKRSPDYKCQKTSFRAHPLTPSLLPLFSQSPWTSIKHATE